MDDSGTRPNRPRNRVAPNGKLFMRQDDDEPTTGTPSRCENPPAPTPAGDCADTRTSTTGVSRRRGKDPYRHILPLKMSFYTTGVLATFLRPPSGGSGQMTATVRPSDDPASTRTKTPKRGKRKSPVLAQNEVRRQITPSHASNNHISCKAGNRSTSANGHDLKKTPGIGGTYADHCNADGYAALHIAAQSNYLVWMKQILQSNTDVDLPAGHTGFTPLHLAARYQSLDAVVLLLKHGASCDASTYLGQRPIHLAARRGYANIVRVLLEKDKGQVRAVDKDLMTPLHMAAINGDVDVCQLLIDSGVDIGARDVSNMTALMMACTMGHLSFIQCVLQSASKQGLTSQDLLMDTDNEMKTVLHIAVSNGYLELARFLLDSGADVNAQTELGQTPLHLTAVVGNTNMAKLLLDFGAIIEKGDNDLMTPLHRAAIYNRLSMVQLLLDKGAEINARERDDFTPLLCACWRGHGEIVNLLLRRGANIRLCDHEQKTCLHWSVEMDHIEIVKSLFVGGGLDMLELQDRTDQTVLHYAAEIANLELLNLLLNKGAKVDTRDIDEKTPLHIASQFGHLACIKILMKQYPNLLNVDDVDGMTPLLLASHNGHPTVVRFLLDTGADIASKNDEWRTALALGVIRNHVSTVSVLIEHNVDINLVDREKNTAMHLACDAGHQPVAQILLSAGADVTYCNAAGLYPLDIAIERQHTGIAKAILTSRQWESALSNLCNDGELPMKKLIKKMPDAALLVLDHCVKKSHSNPHHPDLKITYDYSYIDPGPDDRLSKTSNVIGDNKRFFGVETMVKYKCENLLSHELSQSILSRKWSKFAGVIYTFDFLLYLIFLGCMVQYTSASQLIMSESQLDSMGCVQVQPNDTDYVFNEDGVVIRVANPWLWVTQSVIAIYCLLLLLIKFIHMLQMRFAFFLDVTNYVVVMLCASSLIFVFPPFYPPCSLQWNSGAIANFLAGIHFILYIQPIKLFGIYVGMFITTSKSLIKAMIVYVFFFTAFGMGFYICLARLDAFRTPGDALLTTFVMTLGEIGKSDIFDSGVSLAPFENTSYVLFVLFLFMMPMVLMNLTIGIALGDIQSIFSAAYLKQQQTVIDLILGYETKLPRFVQRRLYESKVTVRPNKQTKEGRKKLRRFLFGNAYTTLFTKNEGPTVNEPSMTEIANQLQQNRRMILMLDVVLKQHTDTLRGIADKFDISNELGELSTFQETISGLHSDV